MNILVVDDEPLARQRLRTLLADCSADAPHSAPHAVAEAASAAEAMERLAPTGGRAFDLVLLDIHMPGQDGLGLAHQLRTLAHPPALVFVTAHTDHAVSAFELDAVDYLTKPVRRERLQQALAKARRAVGTPALAAAPPRAGEALLIQDRGRTERVPLAEVLYFKAEQKYVTVRTAARSYILDGALSELEARHAPHFLRIHRNALVARRAVRALEKHDDPEEGEGWAVRLQGLGELLAVSRRQVAAVREEIER
ncbi:DNA-binding response regulator [Acidovorax sp. SRB_14]|uniref:LytR/AlgR family response regulator transcription factor n=1 Tax=unclassified Acidovorax TaxID=2684926 RepID=UPI00145E42A1|nr:MULTISPECIES: LytTR family DNA-binding domain-containing protein [unclassified Acidovorax]NMM78100.1 DNA-binding response regulator [Acidovorax sp. SRB_24]NMM80112.1 DNA-binding response regulator [Acidovorax sp. SRB_14]NMM88828.1 DNA-binding response regulator [Rhodococcus sp. SRB_17]